MPVEPVPPSPYETRFSCPYPDCRALTKHHWLQIACADGDRYRTEIELRQAQDEYMRQLQEMRKESPKTPARKPRQIQPSLDPQEIENREKCRKYPEGLRASIYTTMLKRDFGLSNPVRWFSVDGLKATRCDECGRLALWVDKQMVLPVSPSVEVEPHEKMPPEIADDFREAGEILERSPRGSAALARLCLQKLCKFIGSERPNLDAAIRDLVATKGLDQRIVKLMDSVRIAGGLAVHPGVIDYSDDRQTARLLLHMINQITRECIAAPEEQAAFYDSLPETKREEAERKDAKVRGNATDSDTT